MLLVCVHSMDSQRIEEVFLNLPYCIIEKPSEDWALSLKSDVRAERSP
jgi:hypothetical protein